MADYRHVALLLLVTAQVCVGKEPSLTILPDSIMKAVGKGVYVSCMAEVDDAALVTEMSWLAPDGTRITNSVDDSVTTSEDGTEAKLDLIISKLREQDVGEYTCSATYAGNQNLQAKIMVESFLDIDFGDTPTRQTLLINEEGIVKCTPKARPAPQVDWFKNNMPVVNDDNHIIRQDGIHIQRVTEADEGAYRCRARVLDLGSIKQVNIQVEVNIPPTIDRPPLDLKGKETESVKFECGASGKPAPSYSWVDGENRPLEGLEGYHVDKETGELTIMDLRPDQSGIYRCTAANAAGEDTKTAQLQVLTKPRVEEFLNLTLPVGSQAELRCVMTGSPEPIAVFKKESVAESFVDGINTDDDRISVTQETDDQGRPVGVLRIRDLARSDDGLYTCTAQSDGGVTQRWGHITVEFKPTFEEQGPTVMWSWQKAPVNLTCLATSIPNATVQWYLRGKEIEYNDPNLSRVKLGPQGVLAVKPVSSAYFGVYTCEATNTLGTATLDLELKEAYPPGPINSAKVEKKTATTLTWSLVDPADDGGLPIQNYIVEYRESDLPWDTAERKTMTKGMTYTIDNLRPQTTYVFRFAAQSRAGKGEWGGEKSEEMPRHAEPEEPMIFGASKDVMEIPYPNHYDLQWKVPLDNGMKIDHFQIVYYQVEERAGKWELVGDKTTREVKHPGTTSYKIDGLTAASHYKIELRAHNDIGYSLPAEAIVKTGNDPRPTTPPEEEGLGTGVIAAIIIVVVVVVVVVVDVSCFLTRNAGLTAAIAKKRGPKDKEGKQAMLEEGRNARHPLSSRVVAVHPAATPLRAAASQESALDSPEDTQRRPRTSRPARPPSRIPPRPRSVRPVVVDVLKKEKKEDESQATGGVSSCVGSSALITPSSPHLADPLDGVSSYDDSLYARLSHGDDCELSGLSRATSPPPPPPPPLPLRNSASHDTLLRHSQETLLAVPPLEDRGELRAPPSLAPAPSRTAPQSVRDPQQTARPQRTPRNTDRHSSSPSLDTALLQAGNPELSAVAERSGQNGELQTRPSVFENAEMLERLSRVVKAGKSSVRPQKTPSVASTSSTLYQPLDTAVHHYPTHTAFRIAPYSTPAPPPSPPGPRNVPRTQPPPPPANHTAPGTAAPRHTTPHLPAATDRQPPHRTQPPQPPANHTSPGTAAPRHTTPHLPAATDRQPPHKLPSRDPPPQYHSMDRLDAPMDAQQHPGPRPAPIPSARSLGSLLDSPGGGLRAYGQPTLL